jgi:VWFA-related protein
MNAKRKFPSLFLIGMLLLSMCLMAYSPLPQEPSEETIKITQVDTSDFPKVTLYVSVVDQNGQPTGIDPSRITISENGRSIPLDQIQGIDEIGPLTTLLVMDISGSMNGEGKLAAAKAAAVTFIEQMRPIDQVGLMIFNTQIDYLEPVTTNHEQVIDTINGITAVGDTAMYDALAEAVMVLDAVPGRKAVIALTDGLDNFSATTPDALLENIGPSGLSISTVGLGNPDQNAGEMNGLDEASLIYIAENAGGVYGYANDEASLQNLYRNYAVALQSEYVLSYTSPNTLRDGVNRALSVSLADASSGQQAVYNPGGLVPEVAEAAPWSMFFALLVGLVILLALPSLINLTRGMIPAKASANGRAPKKNTKSRAKSRIKLMD